MLQHPEGEWIDKAKAVSILPKIYIATQSYVPSSHCHSYSVCFIEYVVRVSLCVTAPYCIDDDLCRCLFRMRPLYVVFIGWTVVKIVQSVFVCSMDFYPSEMPRERTNVKFVTEERETVAQKLRRSMCVCHSRGNIYHLNHIVFVIP